MVTDQDLLTKLAAAKEHGSAFLKGAQLGIVVIADSTKSDVWVEDASIASIILQLTAEELGLGSCWIQIRNRMKNTDTSSEEYIKKLLNIPDNYNVESIIAIGYPDEQRPPHQESELQWEKVHENNFKKGH